ncbi:MAG: dienelactone hydrolase family protein [Acidobacteria bacterium]|nr:dienelactone hydrolase family protein [Acidobacteriota bacterium]
MSSISRDRRTRLLGAASVVAGLALWTGAPGDAAQVPPPPPSVAAQAVPYTSGTATIEAYVARPQGTAKAPGVIVLHDDLGLNSRFRELAHQFAEAGFVALAPHLPSRSKTPASEPGQGRPPRAAVAGLPWPQTIEDLRSAFAFLQEDPGVDPTRISAVGVGWGEYRVWKLAEATPTLYRAVVFYGVTPADDDRLRTIKTRVLGHYAERDYLITARVLKTKRLLGDRFTYYIYPTVPGFFGGGTGLIQPATGGSVISLPSELQPAPAAAAAKLAWTRTLEFLR